MMISKLPACFSQKLSWITAIALLTVTGVCLEASPAYAHHPFGGEVPMNWFEGFMSGLGHPVIGIDHLVFVIAAGLLAVSKCNGILIPVAFVAASMTGTGLHLMSLNLPMPEVFISASVLIFGILLALRNHPHLAVLAGLGAIAGIFHGYAYGEAVIGAEPMPIVAYLAGFALIQMAIALGSRFIAQRLLKPATEQSVLPLRFAGFAIGGAGAAFLSSVLLG